MWSSSKSLGKSEAGFSLGTMCHSSAPSPAPCKALLMYRLRALAEKYPVNATMYSVEREDNTVKNRSTTRKRTFRRETSF